MYSMVISDAGGSPSWAGASRFKQRWKHTSSSGGRQ